MNYLNRMSEIGRKLASGWKPALLSRLARPLPIGLDMGPERLNLVQMENVAGEPAIKALASLPYACSLDEILQHPQRLQALLSQAFRMQPFRGKRVVSCLPAHEVKILALNYRYSEDQSDAEAIVAELRERMKGELDAMVIDYLPLRQDSTDSGRRDALVALAPRHKLVSYLTFLSGAGLQVEALDIGPAALARLVKYAGARRHPQFPLMPNALLINFGVDMSFLTVIWGRRTVLDRTVEFCESRLLSRLRSALDMPAELARQVLYQDQAGQPPESEAGRIVEEVLRPELLALQQEIDKTLVYMASRTRGKSVDVVFLSGPAGRCAIIMASLRQHLKVPIEILNPVVDFPAAAGAVYDPTLGALAGIALASGLALRGVPRHE